MRTKHIALFAAAAFASLASITAGAAPQGIAREVVEVRAATPQQVPLRAFAFDRSQGEYLLEDGRVLEITGKVAAGPGGKTRTLYADLGNGPVELVHVGRDRYVAAGKDLKVRFQGERNRLPDTVFVTDGGQREVASASRR